MSQKELWRENRLLFCIRSLFAALCRITGNSLLLRILSHAQKRLGPYDVALSCMHSEPPRVFYGGTNEIVLYRIRAAKKIAMVHADVLHNGSCTAATDNSIKSSPVPRGAGNNLSRPFQTCGTGFLLYQIFIAFTRSGLWPPKTPSPTRAIKSMSSP